MELLRREHPGPGVSGHSVPSVPRAARSLSVLHVIAPGLVGGAESVLLGLTLGLRQRGVNVGVAPVVHVAPDEHPVVRRLTEGGVPVHPILVSHRAWLAERRAFRRLLASAPPDVVHTHGYRADLLDAGVAREMGIATVTTIHGSSRMNRRTDVYEAIQFRLLRRFQAVVAVSRPLVADLRRAGVPPDRIFLIPNAWHGLALPLPRRAAREALGLPIDAFVVGWVGRLIRIKGCDVFLRALPGLRDLPVQAAIIGDGPEREKLEALVVQSGLQDRVHFHGAREGAASFFQAFDALVLSSRSEGTPMVLFEAMAAGVPIVAADVGGVGDVVSENEACLVPPDDPRVLAQRLRDLYGEGPRTQGRVAAAGARLLEHFTAERWVDRYVELYRRLPTAARS